MAKPKYRLENDLHGTIHNSVLGAIDYKFSKGEVTPKNEGEETVLEELVNLELAARVKGEAKE